MLKNADFTLSKTIRPANS